MIKAISKLDPAPPNSGVVVFTFDKSDLDLVNALLTGDSVHNLADLELKVNEAIDNVFNSYRGDPDVPMPSMPPIDTGGAVGDVVDEG